MSRTNIVATLFLVGTAAPGCLLNAGPYETQGQGGGTTTATGGGGSTATGGGGGSPGCGDGKQDSGEECDLGGKNSDTGDCTEACQNAKCGDGLVHGGKEECDEGDQNSNTGSCTKDCRDAKCGDGFVQGNEECDLGGQNSSTGACTTLCTNAVCGDGFVQTGEDCDDANAIADDGCSPGCKEDPGFDCNGAPSMCGPVCGDGLAVGNEVCDDGNTAAGDGCDPLCKLEATCGNGKIEPGEECDGGAGCDTCQLSGAAGFCGALVDLNKDGQSSVSAGVITVTYPGDTTGGQTGFGDPTTFGFPACSASVPNETVVHKYTTGKVGSTLTIESAEGGGNLGKALIWVALDCLDPDKIDACDDETGAGSQAKVSVGYVPPQTTLYIAFADNGGGGDQGKYSLKVTERPVKLVYSSAFTSGIAGFTPSDVDPMGGDTFMWAACDGAAPCGANTTLSRSGGTYALASDNPDGGMLNETLQTSTFEIGSPTKVFVQLNLHFVASSTGGVNDTAAVDVSVDGSAWEPALEPIATAQGRRIVDVTTKMPGPMGAVGFRYNDDGADAEYVEVDDLYVYTQ